MAATACLHRARALAHHFRKAAADLHMTLPVWLARGYVILTPAAALSLPLPVLAAWPGAEAAATRRR
jgi:hypothetical protein